MITHFCWLYDYLCFMVPENFIDQLLINCCSFISCDQESFLLAKELWIDDSKIPAAQVPMMQCVIATGSILGMAQNGAEGVFGLQFFMK